MRSMLRRHLVLVALCAVLIVSILSVAVYANNMSGKDAATQGDFHLTSSPLQLCYLKDSGQLIVQDTCAGETTIRDIYGNLFTFTHPNTPNSAKISEWSFEFKPTPKLVELEWVLKEKGKYRGHSQLM